MKTYFKLLALISLMSVLLCSGGCMTAMLYDHASGSAHKNESGEVIVDEEPKPGYYAYLPLTVAGDIATLPLQAVGFLVLCVIWTE